ncbi:hypothetical protein [Methylocella sp.]|uniref:hypothetical protein n=1 Tax=Methylocella sp. TaxID=1978226 RepID=UPI00378300ED
MLSCSKLCAAQAAGAGSCAAGAAAFLAVPLTRWPQNWTAHLIGDAVVNSRVSAPMQRSGAFRGAQLAQARETLQNAVHFGLKTLIS